ncbi:MAG: Plug and carboxypeptidase regulatory-like domain-containing protein, partial [Holophagales bacterium]|nr:Plug and carboxypeptidase regulatory-like domain-containing protein [Holophagales bacterium]
MTDRILGNALISAALLFGWVLPADAEETRNSGVCTAEVDTGEAEAVRVDTLAEALELLRREGMRILYTSRLVEASAPVGEFPCSGTPEERLRALLAPLGLLARTAPDGQIVIVLPPSGELEGTIRSEPGGQGIAFAQVRILSDGGTAISDEEGRFRLGSVPVGRQRVEISRPGYVARHWRVRIEAGARHRLDAILRLDAEASDEILVSTSSDDPPLGTWQFGMGQSSRERARAAHSIDQDVLAAASRLPGTNEGQGVAFGVRGHEAARLTLVVDGIEISEPYHFRDLGSLAGAVTPNTIDEFRLHRGSPPVVYGDRAGGILEVLTEETAGHPLSARLGVSDEATQAMLVGNASGAHLRWLAAYRQGEPELPPAGADLRQRPAYQDGLAKLSLALHSRHELKLQTLQVFDELSVLFRAPFVRALTIDQDSRYTQLRYLGTLGEHHLLDSRVSRSEIERRRFGKE